MKKRIPTLAERAKLEHSMAPHLKNDYILLLYFLMRDVNSFYKS